MDRTLRTLSTRSTGFSLVELVIVIMVIGVIAAIAAPRFGHASHNYRLEAAMQKLELDLEYASQIARTHSRSIEIEFDVANNLYRIVSIKDPLHPSRDFVVNLGKPPYSIRIADAQFSGAKSNVLVVSGHGVVMTDGVIRLEIGENARLVGFGLTQTIPFTQGIVTEPVAPKSKAPNLDLVIPSGFPKGKNP